jgi:hypothetical protein
MHKFCSPFIVAYTRESVPTDLFQLASNYGEAISQDFYGHAHVISSVLDQLAKHSSMMAIPVMGVPLHRSQVM